MIGVANLQKCSNVQRFNQNFTSSNFVEEKTMPKEDKQDKLLKALACLSIAAIGFIALRNETKLSGIESDIKVLLNR